MQIFKEDSAVSMEFQNEIRIEEVEHFLDEKLIWILDVMKCPTYAYTKLPVAYFIENSMRI